MSVRLHHLRSAAPVRIPAGAHVLGGLTYGGPAGGLEGPVLGVDMPVLEGGGAAATLLLTDTPNRCGEHGPVRYAANEDVMFGVLALDEHDLEAATGHAYAAVFDTLDSLGYPTLLRAWNYMADINRVVDGVERYRRFNAGRQAAFSASGRPLAGRVPAACALGTRQGPLSVAFLASASAFVPIENPRQVSAYHYPRDYGELSPTFSRAGLARLGEVRTLFVSGTAAIVGHASVHVGDIDAQVRETLANIEAVVDAAAAKPGAVRHVLNELDFTVYVRHASDADRVMALLRARVGTAARVICVQADVCRAELLVEIEAVGGLPAEGA